VSLLIDGTGLSFVRAARWYEEKCGRKATARPWRELNMVIEADMDNHDVAVIGTEVSDSEGIDRRMDDVPTERVIENGAYCNIGLGETLSQTGTMSVIPPPANAVVHVGDDARWHDQVVGYIQEQGLHALRNKRDYVLRALDEAQISRIKRCISDVRADAQGGIAGEREIRYRQPREPVDRVRSVCLRLKNR
jgi:hypothetical protein